MEGWKAAARDAATRYGIPADTFVKQINQESGFADDVIWQRRGSSAGARGIAQFMTPTGNGVADRMGISRADFWANPLLQLAGGAFHMNELLGMFNREMIAGLTGYNAGPGRGALLRPWFGNNAGMLRQLEPGGVVYDQIQTMETRNYVRAILGMANGGMIREPVFGVGASGQRYLFGERGPEYIVPAGRGGGGGMQTVRVDVALGGRVAEEIYITGRELAIRHGRRLAGLVVGA